MQITNLYNKEGSLEDARPKSVLTPCATALSTFRKLHVDSATAPSALVDSTRHLQNNPHPEQTDSVVKYYLNLQAPYRASTMPAVSAELYF